MLLLSVGPGRLLCGNGRKVVLWRAKFQWIMRDVAEA